MHSRAWVAERCPVARQNHLTFRDYQAAPRHRRIKASELTNRYPHSFGRDPLVQSIDAPARSNGVTADELVGH